MVEIRTGAGIQSRTTDERGVAAFEPLPPGRIDAFVNDLAVPDVVMSEAK